MDAKSRGQFSRAGSIFTAAAAPRALARVAMPALGDVAVTGDAARARGLLAAGVDVDEVDENGWTALMRASRYGPAPRPPAH